MTLKSTDVSQINVLIACEFSGTVRDAFIKRGFNAISCDLLETESPGPHYKHNILDVLDMEYHWHLMIAHPPCTYLCNSGSSWLYKGGKKVNGRDPERWIKMMEAATFFKKLLNADIPHVAVENPVMHGHAKKAIGGIQQTQTIQPYEFGHPESKRTCLWLQDLPELQPTDVVDPEWVKNEDGTVYKDSGGYKYSQSAYSPKFNNQTPSGQNKLGPSEDRWKLRSLTYQGIADAMADQWGDHLKNLYI